VSGRLRRRANADRGIDRRRCRFGLGPISKLSQGGDTTTNNAAPRPGRRGQADAATAKTAKRISGQSSPQDQRPNRPMSH